MVVAQGKPSRCFHDVQQGCDISETDSASTGRFLWIPEAIMIMYGLLYGYIRHTR